MNEDNKLDVMAKIALSEYERKEKLRAIINEPFWHYYFGRVSSILGIVLFLGLSNIYLNTSAMEYIWIPIIIAFVLAELNRQHCRFNALVKVIELEKQEKESKVTVLDAVLPPKS